jgi:hypothetical protein
VDWRRAPGEDSALRLARAYFPEFADGPEEDARKAPVNPAAALRVKLPATEAGNLEIATRGFVFTVKTQGGATPASGNGKGATFYGARHFWTPVGGQKVEAEGLWLTQRVEEYVVLEEAGQPFRAQYEVTVPEGVKAVRDAGDYLEFLDGQEVPLLRLHHAVARDSAGLSRQGEVRLWGVTAEPMNGQGLVPRLALKGRTLRVEMAMDLGGMQGPVVVDPGWSSTGSMASSRYAHSATLLPSGKVLVAGGHSGNTRLASAEVYDPGTGTWASTGSLASARYLHTATLLPSGKVLVAGGHSGNTLLASSEVYDPGTGTWTSTGSLASTRYHHTATLLPSGKVLVAGGYSGNGVLSGAEVYDPGTGTWASTGSMASTRYHHTATLLPSGKVLVTGGYSGDTALASSEVYDPGTGMWASIGSMASARYYHAATLLPSGKVLVAGGASSNSILSGAEVYDPGTGIWASTGSMASARRYHTATLLPSGKVFVVGGLSSNSASLASAEVYDPGTGIWASTGSMASARYHHTATLLPSGKVLVVGGLSSNSASLASAEVYDPGTGTWASTGSMASARYVHTATLLPSGKVLVVGGWFDSSMLTSVEVYDPGTGTWASTGPMASARYHHTATLLPSGKVLVVGGLSSNSASLASAEVYDPGTGTWASTGSMASARRYHTATLLPSGKVLVVGGWSDSSMLTSVEVYDPGTGTWASTGSMASDRRHHTATLLPSGRVLVTGGHSGRSGTVASAEVYEPGTGTWASTGSMATTRVDHKATLLPSGKVLVAGGYITSNSNTLASAELYEDTGALDAWRPMLQALASLRPGTTINVTGTGFRGVSEASSGDTRSSATNFPLLSLTAVEGGALTRVPGWNFSNTSVTATVPPAPEGYYLLTVMTNAIPGGRMVLLDGTPPAAPVVTTPASGAVVNTSRPVISGTAEAGSTVTLSVNGTVAGTTVASASGSWSFTPSSALADGAHSVTAQATDAAGNTSSSSSPRPFTVDTVAPSEPVVTTPASGAVVNTPRPAISGTSEPNTTVTLSIDGAVVGTTAASASGSWSFTPSSALTEGIHSVTARATDAAGNTSPTSSPRSFTVDTVAPLVPEVLTPASSAVVNTSRPVISGTVEASSTVTISIDGTVVGTAAASASGSWSFTPSTALAEGAHSVTARATDTAGNTSSSSSPRSFTVDTVAPSVPVVTTPASNAVVNTSRPVVSGTAEAGSTVTISVDGTVTATATANASGSWSFTPGTALADGTHSVTARATDVAGNTSSTSSPHSFTVDTVAPSVPVVTTPTSGAVVNTSGPIISGTAEAGSTVTISIDGATAGTTAASASGSWSLTPSTALAEGSHSVTARATDAAGNTSPTSSPRSFSVDTVAPSVPAVSTPASGAVVSTSRPVISGTAEADSVVTISFDGAVAGTTVASTSGSWNFTPDTALADGPHSVTVQATDAAGNTSPFSSPRSFSVDTEATSAPVVLTPASGAVMNTSRPVISGMAEPGSTVMLSVDSTMAGTAAADGSGSWSFTPSTALAEGPHSVTAQASDAAGNTGPISSPRSFTVDTVAPSAPEMLTPTSGTAVNTSSPVISGTAEAGVTVTISFDGAVAGTAVADASGNWSFTPSSALAEGPHSVTAQASDAAGNTSSTSSSHSFTIDTVAPPIPQVLAPTRGALVTTSTPVISGTAEPGSTVTLSFDGTVAGTTVADDSGNWSFTPSTALAEGPHSVTAQASDAAGNASPDSIPGTFAVDTVAPAPPVVTSPAAGAVVETKALTITGTAAAGTTVTVILDGVEVGTEMVTDTGTWSFTPAEVLSLGDHTLAARGMDSAGNQGPASVLTSFTIATRGHYGGCASAPTSPTGWVAVALGLGWLRRRARKHRVPTLRTPKRLAWALFCLISGSAFGQTPAAQPKPEQNSSAVGLMLGLRSEAELLKRGFIPSLTAELSGDSNASLPDVRLGAAFTALFQPLGLRAEGRLYPYDLGPPGKWRVRPYLALGTTYVLASGGMAARGSVGGALQLGRLQLFADAAYERFFTANETYHYEPRAVLVSLGVGWSPFSGR